jgi:hypothetical protein
MKDKLIRHILSKEPAIIDFVVPVKIGREKELILIADPIQRLMVHHLLSEGRRETEQ